MRNKQLDLSIAERVAPVVGHIADAVSTLHVLQQNPHAYEANPIMRPIVGKPTLLIAIKLGIGIATAYMAEKVVENGHRKTGKALAWLSGALGAGIAIHNLGQRK